VLLENDPRQGLTSRQEFFQYDSSQGSYFHNQNQPSSENLDFKPYQTGLECCEHPKYAEGNLEFWVVDGSGQQKQIEIPGIKVLPPEQGKTQICEEFQNNNPHLAVMYLETQEKLVKVECKFNEETMELEKDSLDFTEFELDSGEEYYSGSYNLVSCARVQSTDPDADLDI
jgi:hypothetical protein